MDDKEKAALEINRALIHAIGSPIEIEYFEKKVFMVKASKLIPSDLRFLHELEFYYRIPIIIEPRIIDKTQVIAIYITD